MIADLKPYADYKESGLPWLGQVPGHWAPTKLKHAFKRIIGGSTPASGNPKYWNGDVTWVTPADVSRSERLRRSIRQISRVGMLSCSTEMVPTGSIVLTSRAPVGNVAIADVDLCTNQGCKALIPNHAVIAPMFAFWLLSIMKAELQSLSTGTTFSEISTTRLGSAFGVLPPPAEQAAIVRFLDWANGRLERTIRAKRKVIALLNEQKQAIIHRAVTRGLDSTVSLKPSGIPWLGDIPQHWEVLRAKYLYREIDDRSSAGNEELLSVSHLTGVTPRSQKNITMFKAASYAGHKLCQPGDLVVNTMWAWMGALGVSTHAGIISPAYAVYRPHKPESIVGLYMDGLLRSRPYISNIICRSTGLRASRLRLYPEEFFRLPIIQPPAEEQHRIVRAIQRETAALNTAISRLEREIELLREYRTRLVADVVTGKLDVREAAARLPELEPESDTELDTTETDETEEDLIEVDA